MRALAASSHECGMHWNGNNKNNNNQNNNRFKQRQQTPNSAPGPATSRPPPQQTQNPTNSAGPKPKPAPPTRAASAGWACWVCKGTIFHRVENCAVFLSMSVDERCGMVKSLELCMVCLTKGHMARDCSRQWKCRECEGKHHTTIHGSALGNQGGQTGQGAGNQAS